MTTRKEQWVGKKYGKLTILEDRGIRNKNHYWLCTCECGNQCEVRQASLISGHTQSCGCLSSPQTTRHFIDGTCVESIRSNTIFSNNQSGIRGVYWHKSKQKWIAQLTFKGKTHSLGCFDHIGDAAKARKEAEKEYYGTFLENQVEQA